MRPADRLRRALGTDEAEADRRLAERRAAGVDVIVLANFEPEVPPPPAALKALSTAISESPGTRSAAGIPEFRSAVARWYQSRFKTSVDPNREVLPLRSVDEGLHALVLALLDPGDAVLVPDPGRPLYRLVAGLVGAEVIDLPLRPQHDYLPELKAIPAEVAHRARLLLLDYPNVPTGATAPASFFHQAIQFAQEHDLLVVHLADFSEFSFDGYRATSLLEFPGSRQVGVELHSPAHTFGVPGWPGAVAVGNPEALRLLRVLRQRLNTHSFVPVQRALADVLLQTGQEWVTQRNSVYQARRDRAIPVLERLGLGVRRPKAVPAIWAATPTGYTSAQLADFLLQQCGVSVAPGTRYGVRGEGYIRLSLTVDEGRLSEALRRLERVTISPRSIMPQPAEGEEHPPPTGGEGEEQDHAR